MVESGGGCGGQLTAASQEGKERTVTFIRRAAARAAAQMAPQGQHLFRLELAVQIFPESGYAFRTFHSP